MDGRWTPKPWIQEGDDTTKEGILMGRDRLISKGPILQFMLHIWMRINITLELELVEFGGLKAPSLHLIDLV